MIYYRTDLIGKNDHRHQGLTGGMGELSTLSDVVKWHRESPESILDHHTVRLDEIEFIEFVGLHYPSFDMFLRDKDGRETGETIRFPLSDIVAL